MVKAKSPLFLEMRKGFKGVDIRTRKSGIIEIGSKRVPFNPKSADQQAHRAKYGECVQKWRALTDAQRAEYEALASEERISGWNYYLRDCIVVTIEEITRQIGQSSDDARHDSYYGYNETEADQIISMPSPSSWLDSGFRFTNITIPQGAEILEAKVTFTARSSYSGDSSVEVYAEDIDDSPTFSSGNTPHDRTKTTAKAPWTIPPTTGGVEFETPELKDVIQEVVNRSGWASGNALSIIVYKAVAQLRKDCQSYDYDPSKSAKLYVKF